MTWGLENGRQRGAPDFTRSTEVPWGEKRGREDSTVDRDGLC